MGLKGRSYIWITARLTHCSLILHLRGFKLSQNIRAEGHENRWYAVWTRSRQEKAAAGILSSLGVQHYLPLKSEVRQWSDRRQTVKVPLFEGYLFVCMNPLKESRLSVLKVPGIVGFVGNQNGPLPIPDKEIDDIQTVLAAQPKWCVLPTLEAGDRVRVIRGALTGVEGKLVRVSSESRLLISIEMIRQSLAVQVNRGDVELLSAGFELPLGFSRSSAA